MPTASRTRAPRTAIRISSAVTSSSRSCSSALTRFSYRADSAPRIASTRAESAASSRLVLVRRSPSESVGSSVRPARYFSALFTSGPATVASKLLRASLGAPSRKSARAASERTRACWAAAESASRCLASASEAVDVSVGRPVIGSMTVWVVLGTLRAASSRPRVAAACWTAVSSSARAYAPAPARGGISSPSFSARAWSSVIASEYASWASSAVLLPLRAARRSAATASRSSRREAGMSGSVRSSSTWRSTRALRCSEGALDLGRPAAM